MTEHDGDSFFSINFATGQRIDLDALRKRQSALMPDNGHAWVICTVYALDDPEQALDEMTLDADSFVGVTAIHCLLCHIRYESGSRYYKCAQALAPGSDVAEATA